MDSKLFSPLAIRGITLKNRIVLSPMLQYCADNGHVNDWRLMHYGKFAAGGAGLVFVESTKVDPRGCSTPRDLGLWKDDFIAPFKRTDEYGGTPQKRMRFPLEVVREVRKFWPQHNPLFFRASAVDEAGWTIEDSIAVARVLKERGVDVIDCSAGGMADAATSDIALRYGYQVDYARKIKAGAGVDMAVGMIIHADQAEKIISTDSADLVALGREFLHNFNWPIDAAQKLEIKAPFEHASRAYAYWLEKRANNKMGIRSSTWQRGINVGDDEKAG